MQGGVRPLRRSLARAPSLNGRTVVEPMLARSPRQSAESCTTRCGWTAFPWNGKGTGTREAPPRSVHRLRRVEPIQDLVLVRMARPDKTIRMDHL